MTVNIAMKLVAPIAGHGPHAIGLIAELETFFSNNGALIFEALTTCALLGLVMLAIRRFLPKNSGPNGSGGTAIAAPPKEYPRLDATGRTRVWKVYTGGLEDMWDAVVANVFVIFKLNVQSDATFIDAMALAAERARLDFIDWAEPLATHADVCQSAQAAAPVRFYLHTSSTNVRTAPITALARLMTGVAADALSTAEVSSWRSARAFCRGKTPSRVALMMKVAAVRNLLARLMTHELATSISAIRADYWSLAHGIIWTHAWHSFAASTTAEFGTMSAYSLGGARSNGFKNDHDVTFEVNQAETRLQWLRLVLAAIGGHGNVRASCAGELANEFDAHSRLLIDGWHEREGSSEVVILLGRVRRLLTGRDLIAKVDVLAGGLLAKIKSATAAGTTALRPTGFVDLPA